MAARFQAVAGADIAATDADGGFRLDAPVGSAWLAVAHDDFAGLDPGAEPQVEVVRGEVVRTELVLVAGCIVRGRVIDADGSAAGEGAVGREPEDLRSRDAVPIGAGGHFRWTTTEPGDVLLRAAPRRSVPSLPARLACRDGARFDDVVLVAGSDPALAGTVATAAGVAAAGAYLELSPQDPGGAWWQGHADRDGRWAVAALPPGRYRVRAILDGAGVVEQVIAAPGRDVALRLGGAGSLAGRVTGAVGAFSIEIMPCRDEVIREPPPPIRRWVAVGGGRYRVDGLPVCSTVAVVRAGGRIEEHGVTLAGGAVTTLDIDFTPRRRKLVSGTVRRRDGSAATGATGTVVSMQVDGRPATPFAIAADGSFRVEASVGDEIRAELDDVFDPSDRVTVSDAPGSEERVELRLLERYPLI